MSKWLDRIHNAIDGDWTDVNIYVEEAACELALRVEYANNAQMYIQASNRQLKALAAIEGTEDLRENIVRKLELRHAYNIDAVEEIIRTGNKEALDFQKEVRATFFTEK